MPTVLPLLLDLDLEAAVFVGAALFAPVVFAALVLEAVLFAVAVFAVDALDLALDDLEVE